MNLKAKEVRRILRVFSDYYPWVRGSIGIRSRVEAARIDGSRLLYVEGVPLILEVERLMVPTLIFDDVLGGLPSVVVDMGAVPHVCRGADVMAPGVRDVEGSFGEGAVVRVVDERYRKALSVGIALTSSSGMSRLEQGRVVKNLHHVGDGVWMVLNSIKAKKFKTLYK